MRRPQGGSMTTRHKDRRLGEAIAKAIKERGLVQKEVARASGISETKPSRVIAGERSITDNELASLARHLGVDKDTLTTGFSAQQSHVGGNEQASAHRAISTHSERLESARRSFIAGHRDELSRRDVEFLEGFECEFNNHPGFSPESDRFWWALVDEFRTSEAKNR